jgi:hypothetical protein
MVLSRSRALPLVVAGVVMGLCTRYVFKQEPAAGKGSNLSALFFGVGEVGPQDDICHDSWVLKHIDETMRQVVEERNAAWYDSLPKILEGVYDKNNPRSGDGGDPIEPRQWDRFDVMMPPMEGACQMEKIGLQNGDGGKLVCGIQDIPDNEERPCIIYSVGTYCAT